MELIRSTPVFKLDRKIAVSLLSFREERRNEMVLRSRLRPQERFPLNEMAIRDRKKKGNYFHGESEIDCYDYNRIITDPN